MLELFILDKDKEHTKILRNMCLQFCFRQDYETKIHTLEEDAQLAGKEWLREYLSLYVLAYSDSVTAAVREIRYTNPYHYIVLIVKDLMEALKAVNPATRPSGCLVKPAAGSQVDELLSDIWADYEQADLEGGTFCFKVKADEYTVALDRILYFESNSKKIILRTINQEFEFYDSMESILKRLPEAFMRTHKSFIINRKKVARADFAQMTVYFEDGAAALISRTYKAALKEALK